jgi:hypothetical protein
VTKISLDSKSTMMAARWRAGRSVRPAGERVWRRPERPVHKEISSVDKSITSCLDTKEEAYELQLTGLSEGDRPVQGASCRGARRHPAGGRGAHCRPLLASLCSALKAPCSINSGARADELNKFYGSAK